MFHSILLFTVQLGTLKGDMWLAAFLYFAIFIYSWAKGKLADARAAVLFAMIIMILIFYQHPDLVWLVIGFYLFSTYGKDMFKV